jgi:hypothetical protein
VEVELFVYGFVFPCISGRVVEGAEAVVTGRSHFVSLVIGLQK